MTEDQIKHMVERFLGWRLPEHFRPDGGISFKATFNDHLDPPSKHEPTGTNLFSADQADAMVRYMLEGLPVPSSKAHVLIQLHPYGGDGFSVIGVFRDYEAAQASARIVGVDQCRVLATDLK